MRNPKLILLLCNLALLAALLGNVKKGWSWPDGL
jgi:hypothetical protein